MTWTAPSCDASHDNDLVARLVPFVLTTDRPEVLYLAVELSKSSSWAGWAATERGTFVTAENPALLACKAIRECRDPKVTAKGEAALQRLKRRLTTALADSVEQNTSMTLALDTLSSDAAPSA